MDLLLFLVPKLVALPLIVVAYDFCARLDTHFMFDLLVFLVALLFSSFKHYCFLTLLLLFGRIQDCSDCLHCLCLSIYPCVICFYRQFSFTK
jgi:hypothetical protein